MLLRGLLLASLVATPRLDAQLNGVPVWPVGLPVPNAPPLDLIAAVHTTSGDDFVNLATEADAGVTLGMDYALGPRLTLRGLLGAIHRDVALGQRRTEFQGAALIGVNLIQEYLASGENEVGASVLGGYGYGTLPDGGENNLVVGLDFTTVIGMGGWFIEQAFVPRWSFRHTRVASGGDWQHGPAISGATTLGFPFGLRLAITAERVFLGAGDASPPGLPQTRPYAWSVAVRYRF